MRNQLDGCSRRVRAIDLGFELLVQDSGISVVFAGCSSKKPDSW